MSVCRYYIQGNCRHGNECRFSHSNANGPRPSYHQQHHHSNANGPRPSHYQQHHHSNDSTFHPRPPRPQIDPKYKFVASNAPHRPMIPKENRIFDHVLKWAEENFGPNKEKALDILQQLQKEAKVWLKSSSFWRFTSRSLFPGGQPLEGWHNQSFEEIRWSHRCMTETNQIHIYRKTYNKYFESIERQLNGLERLDTNTLVFLKPYIEQFIQSPYLPSPTLATDIEMSDVNGNPISVPIFTVDSRNYTPDDQLLEDERAAFESDTFEFGQIPTHAPSKQFC